MSDGPNLIACSVGNTRTQLARIIDGEIVESLRLPNDQSPPIIERVVEWWRAIASKPQASIVIASVHDDVAERIRSGVEDQLAVEVYVIGDDLPVPIGTQLDPETITGIDRLLNAAAAFDRLQQACIVVDAGTAVTVDFVDGHGTFHGGAIAPGAQMQLNALHRDTDVLPELNFAAPAPEAFGKSTAQAMLQGVFFGIRGMVWKLAEQYAERYGAYPAIVATGGDAATIFEGDELVERIVPDLTLLGIIAAVRHALSGAEEEGDSAGDPKHLKRRPPNGGSPS